MHKVRLAIETTVEFSYTFFSTVVFANSIYSARSLAPLVLFTVLSPFVFYVFRKIKVVVVMHKTNSFIHKNKINK